MFSTGGRYPDIFLQRKIYKTAVFCINNFVRISPLVNALKRYSIKILCRRLAPELLPTNDDWQMIPWKITGHYFVYKQLSLVCVCVCDLRL